MSIPLNHLIIAGNLTRDPITKFLANEKCVVNFSIANSRKYKGNDGNEKEETIFLDCTAYGKTAETIGRYLSKGKPIIAEGLLKQETWTDKETGKSRSKIGLVVDKFHFVPDGKKTDQAPKQPESPQPTTSTQVTEPTDEPHSNPLGIAERLLGNLKDARNDPQHKETLNAAHFDRC